MKAKQVVIITGPGFEDAEVCYPYYRLQEENYSVQVVTSTNAPVKGKYGWSIAPTLTIAECIEKVFDAVIIPGGLEAPDRIRQVHDLVSFVSHMYHSGILISSICHGPWVLIEAGIVKGKKATCYKGMKTDLINAGAHYQEKEVVVDGNLVTSDHPRNLGQWMKETIRLLV